MTIVLVAVGLLVLVVYEVRVASRDRKFSATPVVVVSPPAARWWRRLVGRVVNFAVVLAVGVLVVVLAPRLVKAVPSAPHPTSTPTPEPSHTPIPGKGHTP